MKQNRPVDIQRKPSVLLLRSIPLLRDSRSTKMVAAYRSRGWRVMPLVWSRGETDQSVRDGDAIVCTVSAGYGDRFKGLAARLCWMAFMVRQMIRNRGDYDTVHAVDLDTAIVAVPLGLLLRKAIVYDAFDSIGAILGGGLVAAALTRVERALIKAATVAVFPDPIRLEQYNIIARQNVAIISNVPDEASEPGLAPVNTAPDQTGPLRIVYVGTLEARHRGLEYIGPLCRALPNIAFVVGGTGQLENLLSAESAVIPNLEFVGRLGYDDALRLMKSADLLYGPYLLSAPAHRYAAPNKLYEHLMLGKPLVTNVGIPPARVVEEAQSGFLFDGTLDGLITLLRTVDRNDSTRAGQRARDCWDRRYASLRQRELSEFFELFAVRSDRGSVASVGG